MPRKYGLCSNMFASFLAGLFLTACQSRGLAGSPLAPTMRPIVAVAGQAPSSSWPKANPGSRS